MNHFSYQNISGAFLDRIPINEAHSAKKDSFSVAILCIFPLLLWYSFKTLRDIFFSVKAPLAGRRVFLEPSWLLRLRFVRGSRAILQEGYDRFKGSIFKIHRLGTDVLIVSNKHAEELRALTKDSNRSVEPFIVDYVGDYTNGMVFLESDLQNRVVQQRLTPSLGNLAPVMKSVLDVAMDLEIPKCQDTWTKVNITPIFAKMIARITARIFLGPLEGQNEEWLENTAQYTENLFITGFILRLFPRVSLPFVAPLLPTYRNLRKNVVAARRIVGDIVRARRDAESKDGYEKPTDILQYMMDSGSGKERDLSNLSQRMLILSLSSIHTTALTMTQALYDLCEHPEYFEPIREELVNVLREDGGWQKSTLNKFRRLDSLLKESQRFNPVFLVTWNRIFHHPTTLSDGTHLPAGTRVAVPSWSMLHDPAHVPGNPGVFDAFRYSRLRENAQDPANANKHLFAMTDSSNMAFGYGKYACPGRFYASNEMKMVLAHLLLRYDFEFPQGQGRPKNFTVDTDMYPDRSARLMVKKRDRIEDGIEALVGF